MISAFSIFFKNLCAPTSIFEIDSIVLYYVFQDSSKTIDTQMIRAIVSKTHMREEL